MPAHKKTTTKTVSKTPTQAQVTRALAGLNINSSSVARRAGAGIGRKIGGMFGSKRIGASLGRRVGGFAAKRMTGRGDYNLVSGSSVMNDNSYAPSFKTSGRDVVISRSEYLTDIYSGTGTPTAFNLQSFLVNPGLNQGNGGAFSWLCNIAANFQEYTIEQMVFEYRPTSGNSTGSNTALGTVIMCANYQSTDANYTSKAGMLDSQWALSGSPDKQILFPVECADKQFKMYDVRTGPILSTQNQDLFDFCNFQIATLGCPTASQALGELHVSYTVKLSKYQTSPAAALTRSAHYSIYVAALTAGPTNNQPLGTSSIPLVARFNNQMPLTFDYTSGASKIIFPPILPIGTILQIRLVWKGSSVACTGITPSAYTNCEISQSVFSPLDSQVTGVIPVALTTTIYPYWVMIKITAYNASVTFPAQTLPTTCYSLDLSVQEFNPLCNINGI